MRALTGILSNHYQRRLCYSHLPKRPQHKYVITSETTPTVLYQQVPKQRSRAKRVLFLEVCTQFHPLIGVRLILVIPFQLILVIVVVRAARTS